MATYQCASATIVGASHRARGEDRQDSIHIMKDRKGHFAFCLSDGAGSSKFSQLSSKITADVLADSLLRLPGEIDRLGIGAWINDYVVRSVLDLRVRLFEEFDTYDLSDYHCTLVAGVFYQGHCLVAHIGDGAVIAGSTDINETDIIMNDELHVSEAENGEYKNETYFVTEPHWLSHLRIKLIPNVDWLIAGTDGGIDLLSKGDRLHDQHVFDLISDLHSHPAKSRSEVLRVQLSSAYADKITSDDKSLAIFFSDQVTSGGSLYWDDERKTLASQYAAAVDTTDQEGLPKSSPLPSKSGKSHYQSNSLRPSIVALNARNFNAKITMSVFLVIMLGCLSYYFLMLPSKSVPDLLRSVVLWNFSDTQEHGESSQSVISSEIIDKDKVTSLGSPSDDNEVEEDKASQERTPISSNLTSTNLVPGSSSSLPFSMTERIGAKNR